MADREFGREEDKEILGILRSRPSQMITTEGRKAVWDQVATQGSVLAGFSTQQLDQRFEMLFAMLVSGRACSLVEWFQHPPMCGLHAVTVVEQ